MKEFKITEEQIKENKDLTLKEYFKEVFEIKLEVGKWYKYNNWLINYNGINEEDVLLGNYAFNCYGIYENYLGYNAKFGDEPEKWTLATEEEVFNALKKEAEKRGFVKGTKFISVSNGEKTILDEEINYTISNNCLYIDYRDVSGVIFENGKWAEIISQPEEVIELNGVKYKRID